MPRWFQVPSAGIYTAQPASHKVDSEDLSLMPGEGVEIKYHMQKGAGMAYSWNANGANHSYGAFTAPTTGIHGWFWENKGKKQLDIHLTTAGFYDSAKMYVDGNPDELTIQGAK